MTRKGWSHANTASRPRHPRRQRGRRNTFQGPDPGALTASLEGVDPVNVRRLCFPSPRLSRRFLTALETVIAWRRERELPFVQASVRVAREVARSPSRGVQYRV